MSRFDELKNYLKTGSAVFVLSAVATSAYASATYAQDQDNDDEEEVIEEVVVTGSRIKRTGLDTVRPAITVGADTLDKRAFTNIADALNEVPQFGAGVDPNGGQNSFTVGQNYVDLFDLGTQRTLTLVNGRRFVSSNTPTIFGSAGGLQVDLNAIPVALLKSIETVPLAGAAVYGSDAIAGSVNVILRDDYEGFEVSGQYGVTEEGDGQTYQIQTVFGTNFDDGRGNVAIAFEYNKQKGLLLNERPDLVTNDPNFVNFGGQDLDGDGNNDDIDGDGLADSFSRVVDGGQRVQLLTGGGAVAAPGSFFAPSVGIGSLADGNFYQFNPDGTLDSCTPGTTPAGSIFFAYGGTCGVDFFDSVAQIRSPVERVVATMIGHYDISDNITYKQEFMFANSKATELVNQGGFQSFPFSGTSSFVTMSVDNPFLNDQARQILTDNGLSTFSLNRFNNDIVGSGADDTENFTWRLASSLEGDFNVGEKNFFWDVSAVFGQADVETRSFGIIDGRFVNAIDAVRVNAASLQSIIDEGFATTTEEALEYLRFNGASGVTDIQMGTIVCQASIDNAAGLLTGANTPATGGGLTDGDNPYVDGCVPLNLFGEGAASAEAMAFINGGPGITSSDIGQRVFTANVGGELLDLPAGPISAVFGFETRRERADFTPGLGTSIPITRSSPFTPTRGSLETTEFYAETVIPVISEDMDIPFLNFMELTGSARRVKNKVTDPNGLTNSDSVWAYEFGGRISPIKDVVIRGSYTSSIRTPSLVELFTPTVQSFISGTDPCDNRFVNQGPNPDLRRANCVADGIADPDNFTSNISNATIIGSSSGNPNLTPERGKSWNIGVIFEPSFVENLTVAVDYFNIDMSDRIENFGWAELAETCYDSTDFPNVGACDQFVRDADGQVIDVQTGFLNAASSNFQAMNFDVRYNFDVANSLSFLSDSYSGKDWGTLDVRANFIYTINDKTQIVPTREADQDVGDFADPTVQGNLDLNYLNGPFRWFWRISYADSPRLDETGNQYYLDEDDNLIDSTRARIFHNTSFSYEVVEGTTVQLGIDNVFNRQPNRYEQAIGYVSVSERLGRRFTLRVRTRF